MQYSSISQYDHHSSISDKIQYPLTQKLCNNLGLTSTRFREIHTPAKLHENQSITVLTTELDHSEQLAYYCKEGRDGLFETKRVFKIMAPGTTLEDRLLKTTVTKALVDQSSLRTAKVSTFNTHYNSHYISVTLTNFGNDSQLWNPTSDILSTISYVIGSSDTGVLVTADFIPRDLTSNDIQDLTPELAKAVLNSKPGRVNQVYDTLAANSLKPARLRLTKISFENREQQAETAFSDLLQNAQLTLEDFQPSGSTAALLGLKSFSWAISNSGLQATLTSEAAKSLLEKPSYLLVSDTKEVYANQARLVEIASKLSLNAHIALFSDNMGDFYCSI